MNNDQWQITALPLAAAQLDLCLRLLQMKQAKKWGKNEGDMKAILFLSGIEQPPEEILDDLMGRFGANGPDWPVGYYAFFHLRNVVLDRIGWRKGLPVGPTGCAADPDRWMDYVTPFDVLHARSNIEATRHRALVREGKRIERETVTSVVWRNITERRLKAEEKGDD